LLVDQQLRVTDNIDEKNVRDFQSQLCFFLLDHRYIISCGARPRPIAQNALPPSASAFHLRLRVSTIVEGLSAFEPTSDLTLDALRKSLYVIFVV
jgi:hypothetical protein